MIGNPKQKGQAQSVKAGEFIALKGIEFFAQNPEALAGFFAHTGSGPSDLKANISNPLFLASILDYMMMDESVLLEFAQTMDLRPQDIVKARLMLPGADTELVCS